MKFRMASGPLVLCMVAGLAALTWRPFLLGFYSDDWILFTDTLISPHGLAGALEMFGARPIMALVFWLVASTSNGQPVIAQAWVVLFYVLALAVVYQFLFVVLSFLFGDGWISMWTAVIGVTAWLFFPWMLGATAWPSAGISLVAVIFFCMSAVALLNRRQSEVRRITLSVGLFGLSGLTYETFWLGFAPILALATLAKDHRLSLKGSAFAVAGFCGMQALLVALNRVMSLVGLGISKSISSNALELWMQNLATLPVVLKAALGTNAGLYSISLAGMILAALPIAVARRPRWNSAMIVGVVALGCILSAGVYAAAGYQFSGHGVMGRTLLGVSLWFATFIAFCVGLALSGLAAYAGNDSAFGSCNPRLLALVGAGIASIGAAAYFLADAFDAAPIIWLGRHLFRYGLVFALLCSGLALLKKPRTSLGLCSIACSASALAFVCSLMFGTAASAREWVTVWKNERAVLAAFPVDAVLRESADSMLVVSFPAPDWGAWHPFGAFWEITGALVYSHPRLGVHWFGSAGEGDKTARDRATVLLPDVWRTTWDGQNLTQAWCNNPAKTLYQHKTTDVLLWTYPDRHVAGLSAPVAFGCN